MPIDVECEDCGKRLRVRDTFAGKRVKCPGCGEALTVPAAPDDEPEEDTPPPRKTSVRPAADAPRPAAKRPRDEDEEDEDDRPRRRRDEEEEEEDRPRRPKKKAKGRKGGGSNVPLIAGLVALAVLLLVGLGTLAYLLVPGAGASPGLMAFVPGDGMAFVSVRMSDLMKTEGGKAMMDKAKQANPVLGANPQADQAMGVGMAEIERVTLVFKESQNTEDAAYGVFETLSPIDQAKAKTQFTNATDATHEGKTYTAGAVAGQPHRTAVYFVSAKMFVFGGESSVKRAISTSVKPRVAGPLDDGLALLSGGRHVVAGFNPPASAIGSMRQALAQPAMKQFAAVGEFTSGTLTVSVGTALDLEAAFKFPADGQAQAAREAADKGLAAGQFMIGAAKANVGPQDQAAFASFENALNGVKAQQQGQRVVVTAKFDGIAAALNQIPGMMGPRR
ncbi:MAG: hypothetical protein ACRC33_08080 [Gemmataceae bacterium]